MYLTQSDLQHLLCLYLNLGIKYWDLLDLARYIFNGDSSIINTSGISTTMSLLYNLTSTNGTIQHLYTLIFSKVQTPSIFISPLNHEFSHLRQDIVMISIPQGPIFSITHWNDHHKQNHSHQSTVQNVTHMC